MRRVPPLACPYGAVLIGIDAELGGIWVYGPDWLRSQFATAPSLSVRSKSREKLLSLELDGGRAAITPTRDICPDLEHPEVAARAVPSGLPRRRRARLVAKCPLLGLPSQAAYPRYQH